MNSNSKKRPPLGKGLSALLENSDTDITSKSSNAGLVGSVSMLPIESIEANPFNPRTNFEKEALIELSQSIAIHGIIQPLTVRKLGRDKYQLISGERRFRASQMAGLTEVPAYIRVANDQTMLEMALVENIQREDLNAIEVALSYQRLIEECSLTQDQLSQKIAKSRSSITNHLRLLKLPADIQAAVRDNHISMGHARALVSVGDEALQMAIYTRVAEEGLSVRDTEALVREGYVEPRDPGAVQTRNRKGAEITDKQFVFKEHLSDKLSTRIEIKKSPAGSGKILVNFNSEVDLNRIIELLSK
ncbi:MAG: ParB/RepB/Spo0J family partition protein [Bacteroidetes bacterium]|nr:MAG: ParB/RepB/Spo0J family partition protein [Bacteroidota bacterium]